VLASLFMVRAALSDRMEEAGLRLHPGKTKIVYCKDRKRRLDYPCTSFTFLGYTFRARKAPARDGRACSLRSSRRSAGTH
jgi:RNA-directed DNA polymerase